MNSGVFFTDLFTVDYYKIHSRSNGSGDNMIPVVSAYKWSSGKNVTPPKLTATSVSPVSCSSALTGIEAMA